jgi:hypothetical protein
MYMSIKLKASGECTVTVELIETSTHTALNKKNKFFLLDVSTSIMT